MQSDLEIIKSLNPTVVVSVDNLGADYIRVIYTKQFRLRFVRKFRRIKGGSNYLRR